MRTDEFKLEDVIKLYIISEDMSTFPDVVGLPGEEAKKRISEAHPELNVIVIGANAPRTRDYRINRVWVNVDEKGIVTSVPRTG